MAQSNGSMSLNGLQQTTIFTAPADGIYFVQGYLSLPQITTDTAASAVVAVVKQNSTTKYTSGAGDMGFAIPQLSLSSGDVVSVTTSSSAACDNVINAVTGQVYWGNAF